jgi:SAM-dependent methyltransferase
MRFWADHGTGSTRGTGGETKFMWNAAKLPKPHQLGSWVEEMATMANHIKQKAVVSNSGLNILEAGCGTMWAIDLEGIQYTLTGVDIDKNALEIRKNQQRDLDVAILGDLLNVNLGESEYDVIYNSYVLEHINGAEAVLENFVRWLKPGGILILRIPNRDSARGFLTRITPFWFHILYAKYILGDKNAGKPGRAPFPTFFDKVVSRKGIYGFCKKHGLLMKVEYGGGSGRKAHPVFMFLSNLIVWTLHLASFTRLSVKHAILIYVIEKP